jgi:hypothetical protein
VEAVNGDAIEKGPLCKEIVVLFFGTVDFIWDDCKIEAWMVSPGLDPTIVGVPVSTVLTRSPQREGPVIQRGRCVFCCDTDLLVSRERDHGVMFSPHLYSDRRVRKRTSVICDHRRFLRFVCWERHDRRSRQNAWLFASGGSIETLKRIDPCL